MSKEVTILDDATQPPKDRIVTTTYQSEELTPVKTQPVEVHDKVVSMKAEIDDLVDKFFTEKMDKVKNNEAMIVGYKFDPKIRKANDRLDYIQQRVKEQMKTETTQ